MFEEYISPELIVLVPVLYALGMGFKKSSFVKDKYIPVAVGAMGILIAAVYEFSVMGVSFDALYAALIQGILCAAASVYANQIVKQATKAE